MLRVPNITAWDVRQSRPLGLLSNPHELYGVANETARRLLNQAFFTRLYIDADGTPDGSADDPSGPSQGCGLGDEGSQPPGAGVSVVGCGENRAVVCWSSQVLQYGQVSDAG